MVGVVAGNAKLRERAARIIADLTGVSLDEARNYDEPYRLAARDLPAEDAEELAQWLKRIGEIPS